MSEGIDYDPQSMVGHELRNHIAMIAGPLRIVLDQPGSSLSEDARRLLELASHHSEQLGILARQFIDLSRMGQQGVSLDARRCVLADEVQRVIAEFAPLLTNHRVHVHIPADIEVELDPDAFERILPNLLSNAVKFSERGTTIRIAAESLDGHVVVSVADEGIGIPVEDQERIFQRFFQSDLQPSGRKGAGVGLSVVQFYVELHGGWMWVESEPGSGASFFFALPKLTKEAERDKGEEAAGRSDLPR